MTEREALQRRIQALAAQQVERRIAIRRVTLDMAASLARHQLEIENLQGRLSQASHESSGTVVSMMDRKGSNRYSSVTRRQAR